MQYKVITVAVVGVGLGVAGLASCSDRAAEVTSPPSRAPLPARVGSPNVQVSVSFRVGSYAGGAQTVALRLTGRQGRVGSYQGRLEFDPAVLGIVEAGMTDAEGGEDLGILNAQEADSGRLRFAGFSAKGFEVRDILKLRFRSSRPLHAGDLRLILDVVGTVNGQEVPEDRQLVAPNLVPIESQ